ncbi:MAG: hypothetical protein WC798_03520 [Candidatus Paceibacterota bacterium]|jgi:hypothetical protein|nr:hypothetical protein [Ignavibacteriaceae bacterium]
MDKQPTMEELIEKVQKLKSTGELDLSMEEDLSIAVMNLISLEEHFYFTGAKTGKDNYFGLLEQTREIRKQLLAKMIDVHEGETWCIAKHLLAATMRMIEVGTKLQSSGKKEESQDMFKKAYEIYSLFWALRLELIDVVGMRKIGDNQLNIHDTSGSTKPMTKEDIISKLVDCCKE